MDGRGRRSCGDRREGKEGYCVPSGTGRLTKLKAIIQNHASTPVGYGEFKSLREIAVPQGNPAEWVTEVGCGSRRHPGETRQTPTRSRRNRQKSIAKSYRNLVRKIVKLYEKSYQNLVREGPRSLQNRSGTLPERTGAKKTQANDFRQPKN